MKGEALAILLLPSLHRPFLGGRSERRKEEERERNEKRNEKKRTRKIKPCFVHSRLQRPLEGEMIPEFEVCIRLLCSSKVLLQEVLDRCGVGGGMHAL